jgi:DNA helicase-2/ATP-dependent DNA helicase PcrA
VTHWQDDLNPQQRLAATYGDGPLLVIAGAGTGKTRTLACRVAHLLERGVRPERILLLTFTRRAAAEMLDRAGRMTAGGAAGRVWGGTFHAVANRLLRHYGRAVGLSPDFTIMDQGDAADLMNLIRSELGWAKGNRRFPRKETLIRIYSHTVNAQKPLEEVLKRDFPWCGDDREGIADIFDGYTGRKRDQNVLDYDDLLVFWNQLCVSPQTADNIADRFDHVLVDEYQDTNALQGDVLRAMRRRRRNIMVVGDDAQSIYSFRAATVRNILDFPEHYEGAEVIRLEQNYRSTQTILDASNAVMDGAADGFEKRLWSRRASGQKPLLVICQDEAEQCSAVCANILAHLEQGIPLHHQSVLFRAGHHSAMLEVELVRRNMPFHKYGGLKFVEAAHIKDVLAMLRVLENPYDVVSWFRVLQLLEGVGPRSAARIIEALGARRPGPASREARDVPGGEEEPSGDVDSLRDPEDDPPATWKPKELQSPLRALLFHPPRVPPAAAERFEGLRQALAECSGIAKLAPAIGDERRTSRRGRRAVGEKRAAHPRGDATARTEPPLPSQIERLRRFYEPLLVERYDNPIIRARDVEQLEHIAARYRSRSRFITDLTLDPPTSTSDLAQPPFLEEDYLILSTIHSAKGCEWDAVHVIHAADGMIPSDMAVRDEDGVEEERRLFYVAMTRAKDWLYVYFPLRYYHQRFGFGDAHNYAQLTRFISPDVRRCFEERAMRLSEDAAETVRSAHEAVSDRLRRLWGG